jgi:hypothetical protein
MFVPSLSWQNDPFYMKTDKKHRFPHLSLNFLNVRFELVHTYQASTLRTGGGKQQDKTSCHFLVCVGATELKIPTVDLQTAIVDKCAPDGK